MAAVKIMPSAMLLTVLAACGSAGGISASTGLQPGEGVIEDIDLLQPYSSGSGAVQETGAGDAAAGDADAGRQSETGRSGKAGYQFGVRMANGRYQSVTQDSNPFQVGDRVRIIDGGLRHR